MELTDKRVLVFEREWFWPCTPPQCWKLIEKGNVIYISRDKFNMAIINLLTSVIN